jgi:putative SOS response-associated peptidase YedK
MCGRYRRTTAEEELARRYGVPIPRQTDLPISWNIAPSQRVLAIRYNEESNERALDALRWGLIPSWAKDEKIAYKTINARVETVETAPSYRTAFKKRAMFDSGGFFFRVAACRKSQTALFDRHKGWCAVRLRWPVGRLERSRN